ncbi:MAG: DnaJ domain-containing protein [Nitrospiraceae bacterium]|nr:MAG: DnaJ domain-containing protein [Nitrospiraceae bacterium]
MSRERSADKRIFPRHSIDLDTELIIAGKKIMAKLTDFSVSGVGLIIREFPDNIPEEFDLTINELKVETKAKVAWLQEMFSGKRVGLQKSGPLKGPIPRYPLPDFLIGLQRMGKTGMLQITTGPYTKNIFVKQGDVIFSSSNQEQERMADMLRDIGKISPEQYDEATELMKASGKRFGTALVELGHLSPTDLVWAVRFQVEKIIQNLFGLESGNVIFKEESDPREEVITLKFSTGNLIYRGIKSIDNIDFIKQNMPPLDAAFNFSSIPIALFQDISLEDDERKLLNLVDGTKSIKDIIAASPFNEKETLKTLFALYNTRLLNLDDRRTIDSDLVKEQLCEKPEPQDAEAAEAFVAKIETLYRDHVRLGYHGVLGLQKDASIDDIKKAYYKAAKEYHPDRHLHFQSKSIKHKLNVIFAYISEAYAVLSRQGSITLSGISDRTEEPEPPDQKKTARMKFNEGRDHLEDRDIEQAVTLLGQAAYLDNAIPEYHYFYGIALFKDKRLKDAEQSLRKAIDLEPSNAVYTADLGHIYLKLGFKTRAKNSFEKALKHDASNKRALKGLEALKG